MRRKKKPSSVGGAERPHSHHRARGGDLFFCFSSRPATAAAAVASSSSSSAAGAMRAPSSKSLLSPGRSRDPSAAPSLSASLSRRLRSSGSVKGGQSPMFPAVVGGGRRKGAAFEATEPSSPKVTCIGQVRVKSKKKKAAAAAKGKASVMRSRSVRGSGREASFRRSEEIGGPRECLPSRNQRWVHQLPVSICEALRAFGSEFSCFFPCGGRSMCSSSSARAGEGREECGEKRSNSCGAVFARWLMAVPDGEEGKRREVVGVVVEERRRDMEIGMVVKDRIRREDFELEMKMGKSEEVVMVVENEEVKEEEEPRVSICIPPKNALLLMRCRSDPVRMAALASRFWDSPAMKVRVEEGAAEEEEHDGDKNQDHFEESDEKLEGDERDEGAAETEQPYEEKEGGQASNKGVALTAEPSDGTEAKAKEEVVHLSPEEEERQNEDQDLLRTAAEPSKAVEDGAKDQQAPLTANETEDKAELEERAEIINDTPLDNKEETKEEDKGRRSSSCSSTMDQEERRSKRLSTRSKEGGRRRSSASRERDKRRHSFSTERETGRSSFNSEKELRRSSFSIEAKGRWSFSIEKDSLRLGKEEIDDDKKSKEDCPAEQDGPKGNLDVENFHSTEKEEDGSAEDGDRDHKRGEAEAGAKITELPDCLLLMMYEPKLSMEVSKETWVCSTDFLQWRLHHPNYRPRHLSKSAVAATSMIATAINNDIGSTTDEVTKDESRKEKSIDDRSREHKEEAMPPAIAMEIPQPPPLPSPPAPPPASDKERKLRGNAGAVPAPAPPPSYGPFGLTRCKSEPMRSSARLTPDACFWKDRHRPIGATGLGF